MPEGTDLTLALILTGAGTTVAATLIASIIEVLKRALGPIGTRIDAGMEGSIAVLLSAILVIYAYLSTVATPDAASAFAAFLAFIGIAGLAGRAYDVGSSVKATLTS